MTTPETEGIRQLDLAQRRQVAKEREEIIHRDEGDKRDGNSLRLFVTEAATIGPLV
jgi:hypothetical protein